MRSLCLLCFVSLLFARENPFLPIGELNTSIITTNLQESYEVLNSENINFPSDANLLLNIKFTYRANDGKIKHKNFDINKTISGHREYVLSKANSARDQIVPKLDVSVTIPENASLTLTQESNVTGQKVREISKLEVPKEVGIDISSIRVSDSATTIPATRKKARQPKDINSSSNTTDKNSSHIVKNHQNDAKFINSVGFKIDSMSMKILTNDEIFKHFFYDKNKIVIDFKKPKSKFKTSILKLNTNTFKSVTMGWHKDKYRIVIALDGKYKYSLIKSANKDGYDLILR